MHICMISTGYSSIIPRRFGAIEPYVYELSKNLSLTQNIHLFGLGKGTENIGNLHIKTFSYRENPIVRALTPLNPRLTFQVPFNISIFKSFCDLNKQDNFDIVHVHDPYSGFAGMSINKIFHTPWVCSVHNELNSVATIQGCSKVLAVSNYLQKFLINKGIDKSKVDVLNIAIDPNAYRRKRTSGEAKKQLHFINHTIVLFVGRKCPEKGPEVLIDALPEIKKMNPEILVILIGPDHMFGEASNSYTEFLRNKTRKLGIENNVLFLGFVSQSMLNLFYEAADVVVVPSVWQESFGKVVLEAMSYETPVVASSVGGIPEIITDGVNGLLFYPADSSALAESVNNILGNRSLAKQLSVEGKKTVLEQFSFEQIGKRCLEIYSDVL